MPPLPGLLSLLQPAGLHPPFLPAPAPALSSPPAAAEPLLPVIQMCASVHGHANRHGFGHAHTVAMCSLSFSAAVASASLLVLSSCSSFSFSARSCSASLHIHTPQSLPRPPVWYGCVRCLCLGPASPPLPAPWACLASVACALGLPRLRCMFLGPALPPLPWAYLASVACALGLPRLRCLCHRRGRHGFASLSELHQLLSIHKSTHTFIHTS